MSAGVIVVETPLYACTATSFAPRNDSMTTAESCACCQRHGLMALDYIEGLRDLAGVGRHDYRLATTID